MEGKAYYKDMFVFENLRQCTVYFRDHVYVVGGESFSSDKSIQRFNKSSQRWDTMNYNTKSKRKNFSFVTIPKSSK